MSAGPQVEAIGAASEGGRAPEKQDTTRIHIRGSTILLIGRLLSVGLNFAVQVLTVRYLAKSDYGAFAYALSVVSMGASLSLFGLDKAVARFVPIYQERGEYRKMFGTIAMTFGTILGIGVALVLLAFGLRSLLLGSVINDPLALTLLLIIIALSPMQALDSWFQGLFAVFASPQAIFFRRHVLGPALKLGAILFVILTGSNVYMLAVGYLVGGLLGLLTYAAMLVHVFKQQGLWQQFNLKQLTTPVREVFSFSTPLLSTDIVNILKSSLVVVLLEYFASTVQVAEFRAVWPVARLNLVVMQSFKYLFTPLASRLFAKEDTKGINDLYWRTASWIAIFSFPVFAASFSMARPLTVLLFGERYAASGSILALLALGHYLNAAFGFNSYTLAVYGRVRYIVAIDILYVIIGLGLNLWLIPRYGALGAAVGTTAALILYNVLNHGGLLLGTHIDLFQWRYIRVYASIALSAVALLVIDLVANPHFVIGGLLVAGFSLLLIRINRHAMNMAEMFPEILRIPLVNRLLA